MLQNHYKPEQHEIKTGVSKPKGSTQPQEPKYQNVCCQCGSEKNLLHLRHVSPAGRNVHVCENCARAWGIVA